MTNLENVYAKLLELEKALSYLTQKKIKYAIADASDEDALSCARKLAKGRRHGAVIELSRNEMASLDNGKVRLIEEVE